MQTLLAMGVDSRYPPQIMSTTLFLRSPFLNCCPIICGLFQIYYNGFIFFGCNNKKYFGLIENVNVDLINPTATQLECGRDPQVGELIESKAG